MLCCCVMGDTEWTRGTTNSKHRRHVHNHPTALTRTSGSSRQSLSTYSLWKTSASHSLLFQHLLDQCSLAEPNSSLVHIYNLLPFGQRHQMRWCWRATDTSTVYTNINTPELFHSALHCCFHGLLISDVDLEALQLDMGVFGLYFV